MVSQRPCPLCRASVCCSGPLRVAVRLRTVRGVAIDSRDLNRWDQVQPATPQAAVVSVVVPLPSVEVVTMATTESSDKYLSLGRCVIGAAVLAALVSPARCLGVIPVLLEKVGENRTVLIRGAVRLNHKMLNGRPERSGTSTASPAAPPTEYLNSRPGTAYVGSKACAKCHRDIYEQYIQTNMARAMSLPMPLVESGKLPVPVTTYDKKLNRYFQVFTDASRSL